MSTNKNLVDQNDKDAIENALRKGSNWVYLKGLGVFIIVLFLIVAIFERLWRIPWGLGLGVILLIVLVAWGIPSWWKTLQNNKALSKRIKELESQQQNTTAK